MEDDELPWQKTAQLQQGYRIALYTLQAFSAVRVWACTESVAAKHCQIAPIRRSEESLV